MKTISTILLMAGKSERFSENENKLLYILHHRPLFTYSLETFLSIKEIEKIIIVVSNETKDAITNYISQNYDETKICYVLGGNTRAQSVRNAIKEVKSDFVLIHDAARPLITKEDILQLISKMDTYQCGTLYHKVYDTIKMTVDNQTTNVDRNQLKAISTPQFFAQPLYPTILHPQIADETITDELTLFPTEPIAFVEESQNNKKVTTKKDVDEIIYHLENRSFYKIGHSFDFHPFEKGRKLILGGIEIPFEKGLMGHSDADVVYHVVAESIMGALELGDLGTLFPDTDDAFKDMNSAFFVKEVVKKTNEADYEIQNIDLIIYLEKPNLKNYKVQMAKNIKELTNCSFVNVKATTLEKQGLIGNGFGIASEAVVLIKRK